MKVEQYKQLKQFEHSMDSARRVGYARMNFRELDTFGKIYEELYGAELTRQQKSCPRCVLKAIKRVAEDYFKFKDSPWGRRVDKAENGTDEA